MPTDSIPDLIPDEFGGIDITPPIRFLQAQRESLTKKTNGIIDGLIGTSSNQDGFSHNFRLLVRSLDSYTFSVLAVQHPVAFYPLRVFDYLRTGVIECAGEAQYLNALREIFGSLEFKKVVAALIAQATEPSK